MHAIKKASYPITGSPHRHPELQAMVDTSCTLQSIESFMLMGTPYSKPFFACFFTCCNWDSLFSRKSVRQLTSLCTFKACGKQEKSVISTQDIPPNEPCLESLFVVQPELKTLSLLLEKFNLSKKLFWFPQTRATRWCNDCGSRITQDQHSWSLCDPPQLGNFSDRSSIYRGQKSDGKDHRFPHKLLASPRVRRPNKRSDVCYLKAKETMVAILTST